MMPEQNMKFKEPLIMGKKTNDGESNYFHSLINQDQYLNSIKKEYAIRRQMLLEQMRDLEDQELLEIDGDHYDKSYS